MNRLENRKMLPLETESNFMMMEKYNEDNGKHNWINLTKDQKVWAVRIKERTFKWNDFLQCWDVSIIARIVETLGCISKVLGMITNP